MEERRQVSYEDPDVEKHIEAEMIKCFDLVLYKTRERKTKKKMRWLNVWVGTVKISQKKTKKKQRKRIDD